jgi:integrating conjugative element protein (TIGR03758 family)
MASLHLRRTPAWLLALITTVAVAAGVAYADFLQSLAQRESGNRPDVVNKYGYAGLFQMGGAALNDAGYYKGADNKWTSTWTGKDGISSLKDFLASPQAQVNAITAYHQKIDQFIKSKGLDAYEGKTLNGVTLTKSGMIAGAHLVGMGNLETWIKSGGAIVPKDGNKIAITAYVQQFGGYQVSGSPPAYWGVGAPPPVNGGGVVNPPQGGGQDWLHNGMGQAPAFASADQAFAFGSGRSMGEVRYVVAGTLMTLFVLWMSWSLLAHYRGWMHRGIGSAMTLKRNTLGACVLMLVMMAIVY